MYHHSSEFPLSPGEDEQEMGWPLDQFDVGTVTREEGTQLCSTAVPRSLATAQGQTTAGCTDTGACPAGQGWTRAVLVGQHIPPADWVGKLSAPLP